MNKNQFQKHAKAHVEYTDIEILCELINRNDPRIFLENLQTAIEMVIDYEKGRSPQKIEYLKLILTIKQKLDQINAFE